MNLPCCCYLRFCPNRNLQLIVKIVSSKNSNFRFTASLVYHFPTDREVGTVTVSAEPDPVANLLPQLTCRMDDFKKLKHFYRCHWRPSWSATLASLPIEMILNSSYCFRLNLFEVKHLEHQAPHVRFAIHTVCKPM